MRWVLAVLVVLCALPARAQTGEDGYIAARNAASAELKQMAQQPEYNPSMDLGKPELFTAAIPCRIRPPSPRGRADDA